MTKAWPVIGAALLGAVLARELLPRTLAAPPSIPRIVTVHDTVRDTLYVKVPARGTVTTDTVQLVIRETIHDTTYVNVGAKPEERTPIWPVLSVQVGKRVGDTTTVNTFSLRTGQGATSRIYTPGPLLGVWVDSAATPRLDFGPAPQPKGVGLWTKVKWGAIGYASCLVVGAGVNLARLR